MNIEKKDRNIYTKQLDQFDSYLLNIIKRFFDTNPETISNSAESIIIEAVTRAKKEITLDGHYGVASINGRSGAVTLTAGDLNAEPAILDKKTAFNKDFGDVHDTVCEGDDPRLSDARTPLPHTHPEYAEYTAISPYLMTQAQIDKLNMLQMYVHPAVHPASMIVTDSSRRFVTDAQMAYWDSKLSSMIAATTSNDGYMTKLQAQQLEAMKAVINTLPAPYVHPTTEGYKHIPTGGNPGEMLVNSAPGEAKWEEKPKGNDGQIYYIDGDNSTTVKPAYVLYKAPIIDTDKDLTNAKFTLVDQSVIFNSWYRFSHDIGTNQPAEPLEINNWSYDATNKQIVCGTNSNTYIGFISPDKYDDYNLEVRLSSTDADNDVIGVVVAFMKDSAGREHTLSIIRNRGVDGHTLVEGYTAQFVLVYNYCRSDEKMIYYLSMSADSQGGWSSVPIGTTVRVNRSGDVISCYASPFGSTVVEALPMTIDLNTNPLLAKFKGPCQYGYSCLSQLNATFSDIKFDKDAKYIYDARTDQTWTVSASGTWTIDTLKQASLELGIGKFVFNETTQKLFYINGKNDIISMMGNYMRKDEMDDYLKSKGLIP